MPWLFVTVRRNARLLALLLALTGLETLEFKSPHAAAFAGTPPANATAHRCSDPQLTWTPATLPLALGTGAGSTTTVYFSSSCAFSNAVISVNRGLAGFVQVSPAMIASVPAQQLQSLQLTFTVAIKTPVGSYLGALRVRRSGDDDTIPVTLPIQLQVVAQPPVSGQGATVTVPAGFKNNDGSLTGGGPLSLDNFASAYLEGGRLPVGGASITISSLPPQPAPLFDFIFHELLGATLTTADTLQVSAATCTRQPYTASFGVIASTTNIAVYCPTTNHLYKLYLSYRTGDPNESLFKTAFGQLLNTAHLTP